MNMPAADLGAAATELINRQVGALRDERWYIPQQRVIEGLAVAVQSVHCTLQLDHFLLYDDCHHRSLLDRGWQGAGFPPNWRGHA